MELTILEGWLQIAEPGPSGFRVLQHHLGALLADHDGWRVGVVGLMRGMAGRR